MALPDSSGDRRRDLLRWREQFPDSVPIAQARPRHPATCVGVVERIRLVPGRALEVRIEDGTGRLTAVWTGRRRIPGLELGAGLQVQGTIAAEDGGLVVRNPEWALVAEPYA